MSQRTDRIAGEIQSALGDILSRQAVKDPRVRDAGLLTITRIEVSGDLRHAKVLFTVFGATPAALEAAEAGLQHASAFLQREVSRRLRLKVVPQLHFSVDRGYEGAARVDAVFRTLEGARKPPAPSGNEETKDREGGDDEVPPSADPGSPGAPSR